MAHRFDCADPHERERGLAAAAGACRRGELVLLPTETVYAVATDAFSAAGTARMRTELGRPPTAPLPVLVGRLHTADGLVLSFTGAGRALAEAFWPGPLTLVARAHPSLHWDLGDTRGTVSVRMPLHPVALELLRETGPLAVTAATASGAAAPAPRTIEAAEAALAASVSLDGGELEEGPGSTVVDITGPLPRIVRAGAFASSVLQEVVPDLLEPA